MVTFMRIPYSTALNRGRIQEKILTELSEGIDNEEQVDYSKAEKLIFNSLSVL